MIRIEQYKVCRERGHDPLPTSVSRGDKTFYCCKWCNVSYWWEVEKTLHEQNAPDLDRQETK